MPDDAQVINLPKVPSDNTRSSPAPRAREQVSDHRCYTFPAFFFKATLFLFKLNVLKRAPVGFQGRV